MSLIDLEGILRRIQNTNAGETFDPSTDSLEAIRDFIAAMGTGLAFYGVVTAVPGANQFTIPTLAGLGAGKFAGATNPFNAFVFRDAGGASAAPQGEFQAVTAYVTATGDFTTAAFTVAVGIGDEILLINPALEPVLDLLVPAIASGANILERDVIGNKADQPNFNTDNVSIVYSLMSWLRGLARAKIQILGNAQAGSTASLLVDAGVLIQGAGYWLGQIVLMTSGVNIGLSRPILSFNNVTNTVTLDPPFPNAIGIGDAYIVLSDYTPVGLAQIIASIETMVNAQGVLTTFGGTISTDGTEQDIYNSGAPTGITRPINIRIDFTNHTALETVEVRVYYRIKSGGNLIEQVLTTFAGVPTELLQNWTLEPNRWGARVTIKKTGGTNRAYDWELPIEV